MAQEIRIDYILIPVLGRVNLKESKTVLAHAPGPAVRVQDGVSVEGNAHGWRRVDVHHQHDDSNIKGHNIDLAFGGQVDFRRFLLDLRYSLGLTNVNPDTGPEEPEVKNRTFSMMFGVRLK